MKRIVVTGAGGFIGRNLVNRLSESNRVYAIVYSKRDRAFWPDALNAEMIVGDVNDWEAIAAQIPEADVFYHLAWGGISSAAYKDMNVQEKNIGMSINAARLAKKLGCERFVFVGSNQEYLMESSGLGGAPVPASVYGVCKLCARQLCQVLLKDSMAFHAAAFTNVFGPGDLSKRTANLFIGRLLRGESLDLIEGNNLYDWTYIDDAVGGLAAIGERGIDGKQYYVGSRKLPTFKTILLRVRDIICPEAALHFGRYSDDSYTDYSRFDLEALYRDTGFECKADFRESILRTAAWLKAAQDDSARISGGGEGN